MIIIFTVAVKTDMSEISDILVMLNRFDVYL